jgi:ubiquinone/menaquinone biosynthesis C-methylase UbiE
MMGMDAAARCNVGKVHRHLDVAGGTGDVAFRVVEAMYKAYGHESMNNTGRGNIPDEEKQVVVFDINPEMLEVGRLRAPRQLPNKSDIVGFVEGNAEALPFPDNSFDVYTIAFGLRNVTNRDLALKEVYIYIYMYVYIYIYVNIHIYI